MRTFLAVQLLGLILVGSLGVYVFNSSSNVVANASTSMDMVEIQTFNAKYDKYIGMQVGSNVKALLTALTANYITNEQEEKYLPNVVIINEKSDLDNYEKSVTNKELQELSKEINVTKKYWVYMGKNSKTQLIKGIVISSEKLDNGDKLAAEIAE